MPVEGEIYNYTEMFKAIHFFRLLKKYCELDSLLCQAVGVVIPLLQEIKDHRSICVYLKSGKQLLCTIKYDDKGSMYIATAILEVDDTKPLFLDAKMESELLKFINTSALTATPPKNSCN